MTFKTKMTIDYAKDIHRRLGNQPYTPMMVVVEGEHTPRLLEVSSENGQRWERDEPNRIAGYYTGNREVTPEIIAADIDEVDDYVPRRYREEGRIAA